MSHNPPFFGLSPKQYFFGAVIPAMIIISVVVGIVTDVVFALLFAGVSIAGLALALWAQQNKRRLWLLNVFSVISLAGWILFKYGIAGLPEALARLGAMLLLFLLIAKVLKFLGRTSIWH